MVELPLRNKCLLILLDFLNLLNAKTFWFMAIRKVNDPNVKETILGQCFILKKKKVVKVEWNHFGSLYLN